MWKCEIKDIGLQMKCTNKKWTMFEYITKLS